MNIDELKQATTGMVMERPIWLKGVDGPVPVTAIKVGTDALYLCSDDKLQLTLFDLWEQEADKQLIGIITETEIVVLGYRVNGDDIILG